jgi:hypothetical protein
MGKTNNEVFYNILGQDSVTDIPVATGYRLGGLSFEPGCGKEVSSPQPSRLALGTNQPLVERVEVLFPADKEAKTPHSTTTPTRDEIKSEHFPHFCAAWILIGTLQLCNR